MAEALVDGTEWWVSGEGRAMCMQVQGCCQGEERQLVHEEEEEVKIEKV